MKPFLFGGRLACRFAVALCLFAGWISGTATGASQVPHYQPPGTHRLVKTLNREWTFNYFADQTGDTAGCEVPTFDWPAS